MGEIRFAHVLFAVQPRLFFTDHRETVACLTVRELRAQPMRCLCGAKSCRGYIGGTGDAVAADEDMEDPEDASEDPEPIMINSAEAADPTLVAVLESEVGLAPEYWDAAVWQRCAWDSKAHLSAK